MKKITFIDFVIGIGFILMTIGLGIKIKGVDIVTEKNRFIGVEKSKEPLIVSIDINTASIIELEVLPAIGPKTAQKIIDYRNSRGNFKSIEEIKNVSGIGDKTYEKIMDKIKI